LIIPKIGKALLAQFVPYFSESELSECWVWRGEKTDEGYGVVQYMSQRLPAHVISFCHYRYPLMENMSLSHRCKNTLCMNPYHLKVCFDANPKTVVNRNYHMVLRPEDAPKIRKHYELCQSPTIVARAFGVAEKTIRDIIAGRTWKDA
jgi:hypothetical protein